MRTRPWNYILDSDHRPVPCQDDSYLSWWFTEAWRRRVAEDYISSPQRRLFYVSTVFVIHDHSCDPDGPPLLFETLVRDEGSGEWLDDYLRRYATWEEAEAGHREVCDEVRRLAGENR
jgi:hypothetical protein